MGMGEMGWDRGMEKSIGRMEGDWDSGRELMGDDKMGMRKWEDEFGGVGVS